MWLIALMSPVGPLFGPGVLGIGGGPAVPPPVAGGAPLLPPVFPELPLPLSARQPERQAASAATIANCTAGWSRLRFIDFLTQDAAFVTVWWKADPPPNTRARDDSPKRGRRMTRPRKG